MALPPTRNPDSEPWPPKPKPKATLPSLPRSLGLAPAPPPVEDNESPEEGVVRLGRGGEEDVPTDWLEGHGVTGVSEASPAAGSPPDGRGSNGTCLTAPQPSDGGGAVVGRKAEGQPAEGPVGLGDWDCEGDGEGEAGGVEAGATWSSMVMLTPPAAVSRSRKVPL